MHPLRLLLGALLAATALPAQWRQLTLPVSPTPRRGPAMAADLAGSTFLFGGETSLGSAGTISNETWRFDGATWQQLAPATSPAGRCGASLVHDNARNVFVLFGGAPSSLWAGTNETWEFDGVSWTPVVTPVLPNAVLNHGCCFDSIRGRVVVYGGRFGLTQAASANTYEYDGTNWQLVSTTGGPGPLDGPAMCFHAGLGKAVLFGGIDPATGQTGTTTWLYDGATWSTVAAGGPTPMARVRASLVYDVVRGVCVLVGGHSQLTGGTLNDTWEFDGTSWQWQATGISWSEHCGLAYDLAHQSVIRFGGVWATALTLLGETWLYGANTQSFGTGCVGSSGTPLLQATTPPNLGFTYHLLLSNLAPAIPIAALALGLTELPGVPLAGIGMPGCAAFVSPDVLVTLPAFGSALWATSVPNAPSLLGALLFAQGLGIDPGVNAAGLTVSNAVVGVLGH